MSANNFCKHIGQCILEHCNDCNNNTNHKVVSCHHYATSEAQDSYTLEGKISGLFEKRLLTETGKSCLHKIRYLGNRALHKITRPSSDDIQAAIDIVEHVFEATFNIPKKDNMLEGYQKKSKLLTHSNTNQSS